MVRDAKVAEQASTSHVRQSNSGEIAVAAGAGEVGVDTTMATQILFLPPPPFLRRRESRRPLLQKHMFTGDGR